MYVNCFHLVSKLIVLQNKENVIRSMKVRTDLLNVGGKTLLVVFGSVFMFFFLICCTESQCCLKK